MLLQTLPPLQVSGLDRIALQSILSFLQMVFLSMEKHQQWKLGTLNKPYKTFVPAQVGFQIGQNLE
jgi:hypothetical protein